MSEFETQPIPYHRRWRRMSEFLAREMMYDYLTGQLDQDRHEAVKSFLIISREAREDQQDLQYGLQYCELLAQAQVAPGLVKQLKGRPTHPHQAKRYFYWRNWPAPLRWSVESLVIASVVAFMVNTVPWHRLRLIVPIDRSAQILAQIGEKFNQQMNPQTERLASGSQAESPLPSEPMPVATSEVQAVEGAPEEGLSAGPESSESPLPQPSLATTANSQPSANAIDQGEEESPLPPGAVLPVQVPATKTPLAASAVAGAVKLEEVSQVNSAMRGVLYRAYMTLGNVDEVSLEMANVIRGLGGTKAGSVELGWRKPNGSYYHFTLPEANYDKLVSALRTYGPVRIYKERHKRIMPDGEIRLILWVEENKDPASGPAAAQPEKVEDNETQTSPATPTTGGGLDRSGEEQSSPGSAP